MARSAVVAGTYFDNPDGGSRASIIRRHCKNGRRVVLRREFDNPHDENAVAVLLEVPVLFFGKRLKQIEYIKTGAAKGIAKKLDGGGKLNAWVKSFYAASGEESPRVTIEIDG